MKYLCTNSIFFFMLLLLNATPIVAQNSIQAGDAYRLAQVGNPKIDPSGNWVLYSISTVDTLKDKRLTDWWMTNVHTKEQVQITNSADNEYAAKWSPDGKFISFLATRNGDNLSQIWVLDRRGGEARKQTNVKGEIEEYTWSADGKKILMTIRDEDFSDTAKSKTRLPYVINRYQFKADVEGYLDERHSHLYLFDVTTAKIDTLTSGNYDEKNAVLSPDGTKVVFVSNRTENPDKNDNTDLWLMEVASKQIKQITTWKGGDFAPTFSADGKTIAFLRSSSDLNFTMYGQNIAATYSIETGNTILHTQNLDRPVYQLIWGKPNHLLCVVANDRQQSVYDIDINNSEMKVVVGGDCVFSSIDYSAKADILVGLMGNPYHTGEVYVLANQNTEKITSVNDTFFKSLTLAKVSGITSVSKDGNKVSSILYTPNTYQAGQKLPLVLWIHGGPVSQDDYDFDLTSQVLAAQGYLVANVNYRGSNGRGEAYTKSIYGNWGNKEVLDIVGVADYLIKTGIADEQRLAIGGWSYGGILTNYTIATDNRFKAAASGAGSSLQFSMYGTDQYVTQYETELGTPWQNPKKWMELSYPFFKVSKITTPTLFMASEKDFNVPVAGAEQMYQAFKSNNIPTQLVIYPGQYHGVSKPSYIKDRLQRYIDWFKKYL